MGGGEGEGSTLSIYTIYKNFLRITDMQIESSKNSLGYFIFYINFLFNMAKAPKNDTFEIYFSGMRINFGGMFNKVVCCSMLIKWMYAERHFPFFCKCNRT